MINSIISPLTYKWFVVLDDHEEKFDWFWTLLTDNDSWWLQRSKLHESIDLFWAVLSV
jgi:hypothetical protein